MSSASSLQWIRMMLRSDRDPATHYDLRGDADLLRTRSGVPTMNMGYWSGIDINDPDALWKATTALFHLVGATAELCERDQQVLDVGCGFGTNAIYCMEAFRPGSMVGLNLSSFQLSVCEQMAAARGLQSRVRFARGSATEVPFTDASFDKVITVEAAFHFAPRTDFFREAFRVLKPGGLLVIADFVAPPPRNPWQRLLLSVLSRAIQMPIDNVYCASRYREFVEMTGFDIKEFKSIQNSILPSYYDWLLSRPVKKILELNPVFLTFSSGFFLYPWDYVLLKARKPGA